MRRSPFWISSKCHFYAVDGLIFIKFGTLVVEIVTKNLSFLQKQDGSGRHLGFGKTSITA